MFVFRLCAVLFLFAIRSAWADLPLTVEDILTDKGRVRLDLSLAYANSERTGVAVGEPVIVQTGRASFVTLPGQVGERISNSDSLVGAFGLRYGVTSKPRYIPAPVFLPPANAPFLCREHQITARAVLPICGQASIPGSNRKEMRPPCLTLLKSPSPKSIVKAWRI